MKGKSKKANLIRLAFLLKGKEVDRNEKNHDEFNDELLKLKLVAATQMKKD